MHVHDCVSLAHLDRMTDGTGLIQHAIYDIPRRDSGYTTDDNARALRLCVRLWQQRPDDRMLQRVSRYLSFMEYARTPDAGFHNFMSYDRRWLDSQGCGDCQGQAVRSLAEVLGSDLPDDSRDLARELIEAVLPALADLRSLRAQAYVVLAWSHLWLSGVKDIEPLEHVAWLATKRLVESYRHSVRSDWDWFESRLTYANAVLPHALFVAARRWPQEDFRAAAQASFAFLDRETTSEGVFWPIGSNGWRPYGEDKALYDQQPVEAITMGDAALAAFDLDGEERRLQTFRRARGWFQGENSLRQPLANIHRGSCCDGLHPHGLNRNQGAESTLAFLGTELLHRELQQRSGELRVDAAASA